MSIKQFNGEWVAREDRVLFRFNTFEDQEFSFWLTRYVVKSLIHDHNRKGKASGAGFYDYPEGGKKHLWSGLSQWSKPEVSISEKELIERIYCCFLNLNL